jgi:peptidoglycan/xylan/chitin deacetylase (PgdA/CDA1 family)
VPSRNVFAPARDRMVERALRWSPVRMGVVAVYHGLAAATGDAQLVPPHGVALFRAQLAHLEAHYRVVRASDLLHAAATRRRGQRLPVAITFDDDLRSHVDLAAPILRSQRLPATFFLCGRSLDGPNAFWWERLQRALDLGLVTPADVLGPQLDGATRTELGEAIERLDPEERDAVSERLQALVGPDPQTSGLRTDHVRDLVRAGFEIGFHTYRHDPLPGLDEQRLVAAMTTGRQRLAEVVSRPLELLAYPHGRADTRVTSAARAAGYRQAFTTVERASGATTDKMLIGRFSPSLVSVRHFSSQIVKILGKTLLESPDEQSASPVAGSDR